jgi:hypothetical protein
MTIYGIMYNIIKQGSFSPLENLGFDCLLLIGSILGGDGFQISFKTIIPVQVSPLKRSPLSLM